MLREVDAMSFHNPGMWLLAALAVPIVVFYVWHFTSRRYVVATFPLWQQALARRPVWFVLRFWLSLAAQLAILLLMVAALARPYWTAIFSARRNIVLVMDVSTSMAATDVAPSRFDAMRSEAERIVRQMNRGEQAAIVTAGSVVRVVRRFSEDRGKLLRAIQAIEPPGGTSAVPQAVGLARRMVAGKPNARIIVLTDGAFAGAGRLSQAEDVQMKLFSGESENVGITRLDARPDPVQPDRVHVFVEVASCADRPARCSLRLGMEDGEAQTIPLAVPAGAAAARVVSCPVTKTGRLVARLEIDDAQARDTLAADNEAWTLVTARARPMAWLVATEARRGEPAFQAIREAIESDPTVDVRVVETIPAEPPEHSVTILYKDVPQKLPTGSVWIVEPLGACEVWSEAGTVRDAAAAVKEAATDSPLVDGVDFAGAVIEQAVRLEFAAELPRETIAESASGDPLYSVVHRPDGAIAVVHASLDPDHSDLLLRPDFARLVQNAVHWLLSEADRRNGARAPAAMGASGSRRAEGETRADKAAPSLTDRAESDLRVREDAGSDTLESVEPVSDQPLWTLLVGIAVLLASVEWCLYHRRVVV